MDERLYELLDLYLDGALDVRSRSELEQRLAASAEARRAFWDETARHALLHEVVDEARGRTLAVPRRRRRGGGEPSTSHAAGWLAAACALVFAGLIAAGLQRPRAVPPPRVPTVQRPLPPEETPPEPPSRPPLEPPRTAVPPAPEPPAPAPPPPSPAPLPAPPKPPPPAPTVVAVARIEAVQGRVRVGGREALDGQPVPEGDEIETGDGASALLAYEDGTRVRLEEDTRVRAERVLRLYLDRGALEARVAPRTAPRVFASGRAEAVVLGTVLRLAEEGGETALIVDEGRVRFTRLSDRATVDVPANHLSVARASGPLVARAVAAVVGFVLADAATERPILTLREGAVVELAKLPTRLLNVLAVVEGPVPGSVVFDLDGRRAVNTEREAPFGMMTKGTTWTPAAGVHVVTATPWSGPPGTGKKGGTGVPGRAFTMRFEIR